MPIIRYPHHRSSNPSCNFDTNPALGCLCERPKKVDRQDFVNSPRRDVIITDAQLQLIYNALEVAVPGLTPEDAQEARLLMGCIKDTVSTPEDRKLVHGFCL